MAIAALVAVPALAAIAVFQIALAFGAPFGRAAWGGQHAGVLPRPYRVISGVAGVVVYPLLIAVVVIAGGAVDGTTLPGSDAVVLWVLTGFFAVGAVVNLVSRSRPERWWSPVSLVLAICCGVLAAG